MMNVQPDETKWKDRSACRPGRRGVRAALGGARTRQNSDRMRGEMPGKTV